MNDLAIFNESVSSQIFSAQFAPSSFKDFNLFLSDIQKQGLSELTAQEINEAYQLLIDNMERDEEALALFNYRNVYRVIKDSSNPPTILPSNARLSVDDNIYLHSSKGEPIELNPFSKLKKIKANHKQQLNTIRRSKQEGRLDSLNNLIGTQVRAVISTFLAEVMTTARHAAYSLIDAPHKWMYSAILDSRTTHYCASMAFTVATDKSFWPRIPPAHYYCRSTIIPVSSQASADRLAKSANIDDWIANQSEQFQLIFLGRRRFNKYRQGQLTGIQLVKALTRRFRTAEDLLS